MVNTAFQVAWTGPDAAGDFVTIMPAGPGAWTDQPYFSTAYGRRAIF